LLPQAQHSRAVAQQSRFHAGSAAVVASDATPQGASCESKWAAYVAAMSAANPCGWAKSPQQLSADHQAQLHALGLDESWWRYFVAQVGFLNLNSNFQILPTHCHHMNRCS
jgi:hypothetical protein